MNASRKYRLCRAQGLSCCCMNTERGLEGSWIGLANTAVLCKDSDSWNPAARALVQWNDSQQAPCASVLTQKIQEQWELNIRSSNFETPGDEEWTKAISCQLPGDWGSWLLIEATARKRKSRSSFLLLPSLPFCLQQQLEWITQLCRLWIPGPWGQHGATATCSSHCSLCCSSPWNPAPVLAKVEGARGSLQSPIPVFVSQPLPPLPVPRYRGDGWALTETVKAKIQPK